MIKAELTGEENIHVETNGSEKDIYLELGHLMRKVHQAVAGFKGKDSADTFIDSLAFLAKKSEEDADALKLFEEFVSEREKKRRKSNG